MSVVLRADVAAYLNSLRNGVSDMKFIESMGIEIRKERDSWFYKGPSSMIDLSVPGLKEVQSYIRIDNYQIAKEMQLQLVRLGCPPEMVVLDPKGSRLRLCLPDLTPGSQLPDLFWKELNALNSLTKAAPFSSKLEVLIVEMNASDVKDDPKAEALMRHIRAARAEAMKLNL